MTLHYEVRPLDELLAHLFVAPPAYTRLEPQSIAGDPRPGLEAAVHDPLWMLLRQWQFGEFAGEDAGQPLSVSFARSEALVEGYSTQSLKAGVNPGAALPAGAILDPLIEAVGRGGPPDLRARADAGALLGAMLADAGFAPNPPLLAAFPFAPADISGAPGWLRPVLRTKPDGAAIAAALGGATPAWLAAAPQAARDAANDWLAWYRRSIQPTPDMGGWQRDRLEYRFALGVKDAQNARRTFAATEHLGGAIDWWSLDEAPGMTLDVPAPPPAPVNVNPAVGLKPIPTLVPQPLFPRPEQILCQPLRFAGMPADRLWEFEDATVNLGAMDVQVNDPARLCLIEYATVYGADWFQVPLDVAAGALTTISALTVTDTFGIQITIKPASDLAGRFRLYECSSGTDSADPTLHGLLTVPSAPITIEGPAIETVHFVRDEMANMAWAIEESVAGPDGRALRRAEEMPPARPPRPPLMAGAELRYTLESDVPGYWIPLVPIPDGAGGYRLRKGTMSGNDDSRGQILFGRSVDLFDAELPADGLRVQRIPAIARATDGSLLRWTAIRIRPGNGPGASGLAFDGAAISERPAV